MSSHVQSQLARGEEVTPSARESSTGLAPVAFEAFDEYVLVAKLGQGGTAQVFLGLSRGPGGFRKLFVVKRLHPHLNDDAEMVTMFSQEANLAARLHHPNVVQTYKVGSYRGQQFLAMEYLDGQPLNRVLQRLRAQHNPLPPALAVQIIGEALEGLHYTHEARDYDGTPLGIAHRDISPHNIFVTYDGHVKLLDFGIAKASVRDANTHSSLIKGKFAYVAPEQARADADVDLRADLWSMGVTLWECLVGQRLFRGTSDVALLRSTLGDDIPLVSEVAPHVSEELSRVVGHALERDPARRIPSASVFKHALEACVGAEQRAAARAGVSALMRTLFADKIEERQQVLKICLERVPESLPALARPSEPPEPRQPPGSRGLRIAAVAALAVALAVFFLVGGGGALPGASRSAEVAPEAAPREADATPRVLAPPAPAASALPPPRRPSAPPRAASEPSRDPGTSEASDDERRSRRARRERQRQAEEAASFAASQQASPAPLPESAAPEPEPMPPLTAPRPGRLVLDSTPYAIVFLETQRLGITPIDVELPAGTHTLLLRNPVQGIQTTYRVTIPAGESVQRRVALE